LETSLKYHRLAARLPKKRAFITGAASGLGYEFARELAADGWTLGLADRNCSALGQACGNLSAAFTRATIRKFCFDVTDFAAYENAATQFLTEYGGVDVLINNAGIGCVGSIESIALDDFRRAVDINLLGPVHGCKLFVPSMKAQTAGHIINLASAAAIVQTPEAGPYNITKAGVVALSETLHGELSSFGVKISVFMPSFIRTEIGANTIGDPIVQIRARKAVSRSNISAEEAVQAALVAVDNGKFYIVLPAEIRFLWLYKRFLPEAFLKFVASWAKKRAAKLDSIQ
jgi:short-subunit dehydrogenase